MLKWVKDRFSSVTAEDDVDVELEIDGDKETEKFSPVGVRVRPVGVEKLKPADSHVAGYSVSEGGLDTDDEHGTKVNDIKTTGVDPYNSGSTNR